MYSLSFFNLSQGRNNVIRTTFQCLGLFIGLSLLWSILVLPAMAQDPIWQKPVKVYETQAWLDRPLLISDSAGRLHLLWVERDRRDLDANGPSIIYYMNKEGNRWSEPVDVLVQSQGLIELPRGLVDSFGYIHVAYSGTGNLLHYSRTTNSIANTAQNWTPAIVLSDHQQVSADVVLDAVGKLHVVYCSTESEILYRFTAGVAYPWSAPRTILPLPPDHLIWKGSLLLTVDSYDVLHTTWTLVPLPDGHPVVGAYYAHSTDKGETWSEPVEIAPPDYMIVSILADDGGRLHVLYIGRAGISGRYHRWSADGGLTWSDPQQIVGEEQIGGGGLNGGDLAVDAAGILHAVFLAPGGIAHSAWNGQTWGQWNTISAGVPGESEYMSIEVTHGNRLHTVWESDHDSIWYVEGRSTASEMAVQEYPHPVPTVLPELIEPNPEIVSTSTSLPSPTPPLVSNITENQLNRVNNGVQGLKLSRESALFFSIGPSLLITGGILMWQLVTRRKR